MISSKKVVIEPTAGMNKEKICTKIGKSCKYFYLPCNNSNPIKSFNILLCFSRKTCLGTMISFLLFFKGERGPGLGIGIHSMQG